MSVLSWAASCSEQRTDTGCLALVVALQDLIYLTFLENEEEKNLRRISYLQATKVERMEVEEK